MNIITVPARFVPAGAHLLAVCRQATDQSRPAHLTMTPDLSRVFGTKWTPSTGTVDLIAGREGGNPGVYKTDESAPVRILIDDDHPLLDELRRLQSEAYGPNVRHLAICDCATATAGVSVDSDGFANAQ